MNGTSFVSDALPPGTQCVISEREWATFLERKEPLHQWGGAFLHEEDGDERLVRVYVRLDVGRREFRCLRLDAAASAEARAGVARIEDAARHAADHVTANQDGASPEALRAESEASEAFVRVAEEVYRDLLGSARG